MGDVGAGVVIASAVTMPRLEELWWVLGVTRGIIESIERLISLHLLEPVQVPSQHRFIIGALPSLFPGLFHDSSIHLLPVDS